ncbi:hypothetical protein GPA24_15100 [Aromatoleum bremense]|uniref:Uncharacterized protein n=1 Tax=Aromatoleum bremense TaxID=76115 RepID=A0ABX1NXT0_9RHOO|nr:hypothetical protein [Aromatoleum bremense]
MFVVMFFPPGKVWCRKGTSKSRPEGSQKTFGSARGRSFRGASRRTSPRKYRLLERRAQRQARIERRSRADVIVAVRGREIFLVEEILDVERDARLAAGERVIHRAVYPREGRQFHRVGE